MCVCRFLERLIRRAEADKFAATLAEHHTAVTSDGTTVLARAITQHNILATSRLYRNIAIDELGALLDISPAQVTAPLPARQLTHPGRAHCGSADHRGPHARPD